MYLDGEIKEVISDGFHYLSAKRIHAKLQIAVLPVGKREKPPISRNFKLFLTGTCFASKALRGK